MSKSKNEKSAVRDGADALVFAVVAASLKSMLLFGAIRSRQASIEKSLRVWRFPFCKLKCIYGTRIPGL